MPDVIYKLRRGLKLMLEHIYTPIQVFLTRVTSTGISADTLSAGRGTFRVTLHQPAFDHALVSADVAIPFILPPLQEDFSATGASTRPTVKLEEVSIAFDQKGGATAVKGRGANVGKASVELAGNQTIKVAIRSKARNTDFDAFTEEIWSTNLGASNFQAWTVRSNPIAIGNLKVAIDQNKSYALIITAPDLDNTSGAADFISFWSLTISMKFSHELVQRDTGATIQNIPSPHDGARATAAQVFVPPASDAVITADAATGVSTAFEFLDSYVRGKYRGGYHRDSTRHDTAPFENILTDASYEVIAVPMFGNLLSVTGGTTGGGGLTPNSELPYADLAGGWSSTGGFIDRRLIPIQYPLTVHHVIAARNYSTYAAGGTLPTSTDFNEYVGVGIGRGLLGQTYTYEQVAFTEWHVGAKNTLIDASSKRALPSNHYIWEMFSVPLVDDAVNMGTGYHAQGKPYFIGRAIENPVVAAGYTPSTSTRRNVGTIAHASRASQCEGQENFIEVRWKFQDSFNDGSGGPDGIESPEWGATKSLIGFGGHWVYLICKKHLV